MPTKYEQFANNASTTLAGDVSVGATSISVASASGFPTDGNFRIIINNEILLVTAVSGTTFTVERAQENTGASTHTTSDTVTLHMTNQSMIRLAADYVPFFNASGNGAPGPYCSLTDIDGNTLTLSDFTGEQLGSTSSSDLDNGAGITMDPHEVSGVILRTYYKTAPSTPYTVYAAFCPNIDSDSSASIHGIGFRESSSGKLKTIATCFGTISSYFSTDIVAITNWNAANSFNSHDTFQRWGWNQGLVWFRIADNGTNISFAVSTNGASWQVMRDEARGTFFDTGPNQIMFGWRAPVYTPGEMKTILTHWSEE